MPHFFAHLDGSRATIGGEDAVHLARSLRARPGEIIKVVDPAGWLLEVRLHSVSPDRAEGTVVSRTEHRPEPRLAVTVAIAMLPGHALEDAIGHCTEVGAAAFVLVESQRGVIQGEPGSSRKERWRRIAREAAMLAGRLVIPPVEGPMSLADVLASCPLPVVLDRLGAAPVSWAARLADPITMLVGPEGGWSPAELAMMEGLERVSLGPRNLRAETAAVAGLSAVLSASERDKAAGT